MSETNWELMAELREHLVWLRDNEKEYKFDMSTWLAYEPKDGRSPCIGDSIAMLRKEVSWLLGDSTIQISATECGTAACLAGHVALLTNIPEDRHVQRWAREQLRLDDQEAHHMFSGMWSDKAQSDITIHEAIDYLDLAIATRNVFQRIKDDDDDFFGVVSDVPLGGFLSGGSTN